MQTNRVIKMGVYGVVALGSLFNVVSLKAQTIDTATFSVESQIGTIDSLETLFNWVANLMKYIGWAGVIIGVIIIIALLIYKLVAADDEETMKKVQGGITKAVVVVILGILLLSAGFILTVVAKLLDAGDLSFTFGQGTEGTGGS